MDGEVRSLFDVGIGDRVLWVVRGDRCLMLGKGDRGLWGLRGDRMTGYRTILNNLKLTKIMIVTRTETICLII